MSTKIKTTLPILLVLFILGCAQKPDVIGTWVTTINNDKFTTIIRANGTVRHQRNERFFESTWERSGDIIVMYNGRIKAKLIKGNLYATENGNTSILTREKE